MLTLMIVAVNLVLGVRWLIAMRSTKASNACVDNLRELATCKEQWARQYGKTSNDIPTWNDIRVFTKVTLVCPEGGTYTLGRLGESPTCSVGGPGHTLPAEQ